LEFCRQGRRQSRDLEYLLRGTTSGARGDIVQEIIAIVRDVVNGPPPGRPDALDDDMPGG
jgi:hypothetical protein